MLSAMDTIAIRPINPGAVDEIGQIRAVIAAANEQFRGDLPADPFRKYLESAMDVVGRLDGGEVLVAVVDDRLVGSITFYREAADEGMPVSLPPDVAGIRATAVHPAARGRGVGRHLVDACIERAAACGAGAVALHTARFMTGAMRLYESAGFERRPVLDYPAGAFFGSEPSPDFIAMGYVRSVGSAR
jgi:GNAT superfamily N-acetyltransferase